MNKNSLCSQKRIQTRMKPATVKKDPVLLDGNVPSAIRVLVLVERATTTAAASTTDSPIEASTAVTSLIAKIPVLGPDHRKHTHMKSKSSLKTRQLDFF